MRDVHIQLKHVTVKVTTDDLLVALVKLLYCKGKRRDRKLAFSIELNELEDCHGVIDPVKLIVVVVLIRNGRGDDH
jgi:hypothetical protein